MSEKEKKVKKMVYQTFTMGKVVYPAGKVAELTEDQAARLADTVLKKPVSKKK